MSDDPEYLLAIICWSIIILLPVIWSPLLAVSAAWIAIGMYCNLKSTSTGVAGDLMFLATWPVHVWREW